MVEQEYRKISKFDRAFGGLSGKPDVTKVKPSTVVTEEPIIGAVQQVIVQTMRQAEVGDFIFITHVDDEGATRLVIPPAVADAIARQREALGTKKRKRAAKARAAADKAQGKLPGFLRKKVDNNGE